MTRILLLLLLLPIAGSEEPADDPEALEFEARPEHTASGPDPLPDPALGEELLSQATALLTEGAFEDAVAIAVPAISQYPALAPSFRVIADLAMDQLHRATSTSANIYMQPARSTVERRIGFEMGTCNGMRLDWKMSRRTIDSMGLRLSAGPMINSWGVYFVTHATYYLDWNLGGNLQLETPVGLLLYDGWPYGVIGASLQYDPPNPIQVNLGANLFVSGFFPELSVAFLW